jgi:hypothetical protein
MRGMVEIYQIDKSGKKKLHARSNLIVYLGREWLLSRIVNVNNTNILPTDNLYLSWLSVGTGGAPATDPLNPIPPSNTDISLANQIVINASNASLADNGNYIGFSDVTFLQDNLNLNSYLIMRLDVLLDETMANGNNLNEAGLWISNSNNAVEANQFYLFARNTFPTLVKSPAVSLQFIWYIYS